MSETALKDQWKQEEKTDYCSLATPDKDMRAYVRRSGCINLLFYSDEWLFEHDRHTYDWHICDIDEAIALLQGVKAQAIAYFAEKGETWPAE